MDAAISERVRVLARSKTHLEAYNIKGKEHTGEMVKYLNGLFESKGIEIRSVIITNVKLDPSIAAYLEEKATYASKNTLEIRKQFFEIRVINDDQEYEMKKELMKLDRDKVQQESNQIKAVVEKDKNNIEAETRKIIQEIMEQTVAEINKIRVESELEAQEIIGETNITKTVITADGAAKAKTKLAKADCYVLKKNAEAQLKAASKVADEITVRGRAEAELAKNLASRRRYEYLMAKLSVIRELALNNSLTILGDQKENILAQLETFKLLKDK